MDRFQLKHATICHFCRSRNLELERSKFRGDHESSGYGAAVFLSESGTTAFEALKDLLLEIAQERELGTLLPLIVRLVAERRAVIVADATSDPYIKRPEWVREEGIQSFGGQPLLYREHVLGVLGVFLRMRL